MSLPCQVVTANLFKAVLSYIVVIVAGVGLAGELPTARFHRGFNLNGPSIEIDGNLWEGEDGLTINGARPLENQEVRLIPATDRSRAKMIRTSRTGGDLSITLKGLPAGDYQVVAYVWEDNQRTEFRVLLNDVQMIERHSSGPAGSWSKLGPWPTRVDQQGTIKLAAQGGQGNVSGIEVWQGRGLLPTPPPVDFNLHPTAEQVSFFESKIRPILVDHCYDCHSVEAQDVAGGLLLDSQGGLIAGGSKGRSVIPSDPQESLLIRAVRHVDPSLKMPPDSQLTEDQVESLITWIAQGAPDPRTADTVAAAKKLRADLLEKATDFWSLRPLSSVREPTIHSAAAPWAANHDANPIDRFIVAQLQSLGLPPAPPADRQTLIRRATFDLLGLPPTPAEIDAFVNDSAPHAFEKLVERLLHSPQYGERWGRHWLDVVRYADTAGDNSDFPIPQMAKYRDWVIQAIQDDLPYDQFVTEQLAGDLIPSADREERLRRHTATGYIANARRFGSRTEDYPQHLTIEDTLDNLGRAFLATTINCARCHDHKFDPITSEDYYALYGIFHSTRYPWPGIELDKVQRNLIPVVEPEEVEDFQTEKNRQIKEFDRQIKELSAQAKGASNNKEERDRLNKEIESLKKERESLEKSPPPYEQLYAVIDAKRIEDVQIQIKGDPSKPGKLVARRFISALGGTPLPEDDTSSGRLALARWITDVNNPLTYRVFVNRVWHWHFGQGLVPTPNDFGRQGTPPTHPELLDYLAGRFIEQGSSLRALHRMIMLSATYQQASDGSDKSLQIDPANKYLSRFPKRRLEAEAIRDTLLQLAGKLDFSPAPPHPFPPQKQWGYTQHNPFKAVYATDHRSIYLMTQRIQRHPFLAIFDGADPATSTPKRLTSTTPVQSLYLLNDPLVHECAERFAAEVVNCGPEFETRLEFAFRSALGRRPTSLEIAKSFEFVEAYAKSSESVDSDLRPWQALVRVLFRLNEFIYVD
jgi:hypothetical protein